MHFVRTDDVVCSFFFPTSGIPCVTPSSSAANGVIVLDKAVMHILEIAEHNSLRT
ncbi:MAG: hypothetical protein QOI43_2923 [Gaiellales bacterium]|nr:hypothetical protein [Gaiellales bacterium]